MSKISTAYDYFVTQLGTLFSTKSRLPNPYSLEDNSAHMLKDSYGIKVGSHNFFNADFSTISHQYNITIVFCREVIRMDHNVTTFDTVSKNLSEDAFTLREFFYDTDNLNSTIDKIDLGTTDPIGFFVSGKNNFLFTETTISTLIRENF